MSKSLSRENPQSTNTKVKQLDVDLLMLRIMNGGQAAQFLADAFISSYRLNTLFEHSLAEFLTLDEEAKRLFQEILHIRFFSDLNDAELYEIEKMIVVELSIWGTA